MQHFARLFDAIDRTTSTNAKVEAMASYFKAADPRDAAWALFFLSGRRVKRTVRARLLADWAMERVGVPEWLFGETYSVVADLAEAIALLVDRRGATPPDATPLHEWVEGLLPLGREPMERQRRAAGDAWDRLTGTALFLWTKMLTGELRVGVSRGLVIRALGRAAGLPEPLVAHRLMGEWQPTAEFFGSVVAPDTGQADAARPYPFFLASPLDAGVAPAELDQVLGERGGWQAEWKWDGIRAQLIRRGGVVRLWSRGEELITERFPEITAAAAGLPDGTVLDGEVLVWRDGRPMPFAVLQRRIGRIKLTPAILEGAPAVFLAYDLLELDAADLRERPLSERRAMLEGVIHRLPTPAADHGVAAGAQPTLFQPPSLVSAWLMLSPVLDAPTWQTLADLRAASREHGVEGIMLKRLTSPYQTGRTRGDWWKWKIDPYTIDAVLVYAQPGHGRRANLLTDYTFAVWDAGELVPLAKAYSGLDQAEIERLDSWIRRHTIERFGPVRAVEPVQVFELAFEALRRSPRHKAGVALRFPRMARWRIDKPAAEADTLERVKAMIDQATRDRDRGSETRPPGRA